MTGKGPVILRADDFPGVKSKTSEEQTSKSRSSDPAHVLTLQPHIGCHLVMA